MYAFYSFHDDEHNAYEVFFLYVLYFKVYDLPFNITHNIQLTIC